MEAANKASKIWTPSEDQKDKELRERAMHFAVTMTDAARSGSHVCADATAILAFLKGGEK